MQGLLERESELDALDVAMEAARAGDGQALLVAGPAGIGKSRLLAAAEERCDEATLVLRARGGPLEQDFSYGVMRQLLERHLAQAGEARRETMLDGPAALALPAVGALPARQPTAVDAAFSIRHGLHWLVANIAQEQPVVLLVDDLHWADPASLRALAYLAARLDGLPVLLVGGWRSGEPVADEEPLAELERLAATVLRPAPLAAPSVRAFLEAEGGSPSPELVEAVRMATGGNPFLLEELLRSLRAEGLDVASARPDTVERLGPRGVARALVVRLGRLPPALTTVARAVAVLAGNAQPGPVGALAGIGADEVAGAVDQLVAAEILAPGRPYTYLHPMMRAAVYEDTPSAHREELHAAAVVALRRDGRSDAELAPHLLATAPAGEAGTVASLRAAAALAVAQGAPDLAVRYLRRALEEPPADDQRVAVLGELGDAEWLTGEDPEGAIAHLAAAFEGASEPARRLERALALHRALFARGRLAEAMELLEEELRRSGPLVEHEIALRVESELASIGLLHPSTVDRADARLAEYEDLQGTTPAELLQLANVACWKWAKGTADETLEIGRRSMADARIQAADPSDSLPIYEALWALAHTDELEFARDVLDQTLADARARGSVFGITTSCGLLVLLALREGDTASAEVEGRRAARLPGLSDFIRPPLFGYLAQALVWRGELEAAEWAIGESGCGPDLPEFVCLNPVFGSRGRLRLAQGRAEEALRDFEELGARSDRIGLLNPVQGWRLGAAAALVRLGRAGEAIPLAEEQLRLARRWGTSSAIGAAMHALALARGGRADELAEAERVLAEGPERLEHARCLVDLGASLRSDGRRRDAREPLRQALDIAWRCGAKPLAGRAYEELLAAGARPRRLTSSGADSLTPSERRVAGLAAEGRTNREIAQELFVTPKTVENQLGRVYGKLGVSSRKELAGALATTDDATPRPAAVANPPQAGASTHGGFS